MRPLHKWAIGLAFALVAAWLVHGPLGRGEAFVDRMQRHSELVIAAAELDVQVRFDRSSLSRVAHLSGEADAFQREGQGSFPGLNDRIMNVPGVSRVAWDDEPASGWSLPLLAETLLMVLIAFGLGAAFGAFIFRRRRETFLE